jgi:ABC-2 type transport system permease protein
MRAFIIFRKTLREVSRDPMMIVLTLVFAPALVVLYKLVFPELAPSYEVVVVDQDQVVGNGTGLSAGDGVTAALRGFEDADGRPLLQVRSEASLEAAEEVAEQGDVAAILVIPQGFSQSLAALTDDAQAEPVEYTLSGDLTSAKYLVAAVLVDAGVQEFVAEATGRSAPVQVSEVALGGSGARTDFEIYVPGLIVFALIMLVFLAAMTVAREYESGGMRRLRLTRMTGTDYVVGTSGVLTLIGAASVVITFAAAWLCGFRSQGPMWVAGLLLVITTLSVIGVGMMVAAVSRTVVRAFVVANFPLAVLMFFTGAMFPMPRITWFEIAGHPVGPFELLAPTHAVTALNRVFTMGAGLADVAFELTALVVLTAAYLALGVVLLGRSAAPARGHAQVAVSTVVEGADLVPSAVGASAPSATDPASVSVRRWRSIG